MRKIAILVLAHKNIEQVKFFCSQFNEKLYDIYIHLDKKYKEEVKSFSSNVFILDPSFRVDIKWGEFSMVEAMIKLLESSINDKYSHYWFVSGQDLILKKSDDIFNDIVQTDYNYINFFEKKYTNKFQYRNNLKFRGYIRSNKLYMKIMRKMIFKLSNITSVFKKKHFFGSQWSLLTSDFVKYLLAPNVLEYYMDKFKNRIVPDESYFQTVIMESRFKDKIKDHNLLVIWDKNTNHPRTFTMCDCNLLADTDKHIARKFDYQIDNEIIDKIGGGTK